jgi:hypothetical protein
MTRHTNRARNAAERRTGASGGDREARPIDATRVLSVGAVLGRTFSTWWADAPKFAAVFLVVNVPILLLGAWTYSAPPTWLSNARTYGWAVGFGSWLLETVAVGATVHGTFQRLVGRPMSLRRCLSIGVSRFGSLVGISVRIGGLVIGIGLAVYVVLGIATCSSGAMRSVSPFGVGMWLVAGAAFLVPMLIVTLRYFTAAPVCITEGMAAGEAMWRARGLQRGNGGPVLGLAAILWGARVALSYATMFALGGESASAVAGHPERVLAAFEAARRVALVGQATDLLLFSPLFAVAATVAYHDLRRGKEGVETEELVRVFE